MLKLDPCGGGHADSSGRVVPSFISNNLCCVFFFFPVSSKRFSAKVSRSVMDPHLWGLHLCPTGLAEAGRWVVGAGQTLVKGLFPLVHQPPPQAGCRTAG